MRSVIDSMYNDVKYKVIESSKYRLSYDSNNFFVHNIEINDYHDIKNTSLLSLSLPSLPYKNIILNELTNYSNIEEIVLMQIDSILFYFYACPILKIKIKTSYRHLYNSSIICNNEDKNKKHLNLVTLIKYNMGNNGYYSPFY